MKRPVGAMLGGVALGVLLVHAWVIEGLGARQRPAAAEARPMTVRSVAAEPVLLANAEAGALTLAPAPPPSPAVADTSVPRGPGPLRSMRDPVRATASPETTVTLAAPPMPSAPAMSAAPADATEPAEPKLMAAASDAGSAHTASAATAPVPTYRTRIPGAAQVSYRLSRSGIVGSGEIDWRPAAGSYSLKLEGKVPIIGTLITQTSSGGFDAAGIAPTRHTDKRLRRAEQAANFQRAAGVVSFSGGAAELPWAPGTQDRLSVMLQLAAIANAWSKPPPAGEHYRIQVVGARGDAHVWSIRFEGTQSLDLPGGAVPTLRFLREPETPHDTRAEFWLDPAHQFLPARVLLTDGDGDALELLRNP